MGMWPPGMRTDRLVKLLTTMGIRLRAGRQLRSSDTDGAPVVAIVNESLAKQLFGTTDVVGRRFVLGLGSNSPETEIIGISADT